jgi:tetratricopeptide (TPR) repeat protein
MKLFSLAEVAHIVNLTDSRIRSFVRAGCLEPARSEKKSLRFTFQDLLLLKTAKTLLDSRIPVKRIARMLASLKRQLPDERHLTSVKIYADGHRVVAWDGRARWQPDSGQFLFNFDAKSVVPPAAKSLAPKPAKNKLGASHWFNLGVELEATSAEEARQAYQKALALDPEMSDAHLNLGRLYHEAGKFRESETHYRAALKHAPDEAAPHFNLGVLLQDLKRPHEAARCYYEALVKDANFADAHYNLGLLLDAMGKKQEAFTHLRTARKLYIGK